MKFRHVIQKFLADIFLQEIARRPSAKGLVDTLIIFEHGQHHDLCVREAVGEFSGAFDPGHLRQADIHQNDVRRKGGQFLQSRLSVGKCSDEQEPRRCFLYQPENCVSQLLVIVHQGDLDRSSVHS